MRKLDLQWAWRLAVAALALALSACASGAGGGASKPRPGPVVPPQVVYRIDDHRYFELTPDETCFGNMLYFIDTAKGIRSQVVAFDAVMNRTTLIIDAANDQYLVAPVTRGNINCSSGGGGCGDKMPYSTDGGRTWKRVWAPATADDVMLGGSTVYQYHHQTETTRGMDLAIPMPQGSDWKSIRGFVFKPRIAPVDTKVRCSAKPEGGQR